MTHQHRSKAQNDRDVRRHRAKTKNLISLRVCLLCKYAFISGRGSNTCLECHFAQREQWQKEHPHCDKPIHAAAPRISMVRRGFLCAAYRATVNPAISCPDEGTFLLNEAIRSTFATYAEPIGRRVVGWKRYPNLQFEGFKTGRPQTKVRILA